MINAIIGLLIFIVLFGAGYVVVGVKRIAVHDRRAIGTKPIGVGYNYWKIARLEIELFGETKPNADSPIAPWCKTEAEMYGIDKTGHLADGSCNRNAALGPPCTRRPHQDPPPFSPYSPLPSSLSRVRSSDVAMSLAILTVIVGTTIRIGRTMTASRGNWTD